MQSGKDMEQEIFDTRHIQVVLAEIENTFPGYFSSFKDQPLESIFKEAIADYESEQPRYENYMNMLTLLEFEDNPNAFKRETKAKCPIIRRCLMSNDDVMKQYKISFNEITARELLNGVKNIAQFELDYMVPFDDENHEKIQSYMELNLEALNQPKYGCRGVIGYGVQSSLLYGQHSRAFAHRSQNSIWSLYFLTNKKDFGLEYDSEFLMVQPKYNTCEQNYFYPADLFGFYALKLYLLLKPACEDIGVPFYDRHRYIYLDAFTDYVASLHSKDIQVLKWSSDHVENHWH